MTRTTPPASLFALRIQIRCGHRALRSEGGDLEHAVFFFLFGSYSVIKPVRDAMGRCMASSAFKNCRHLHR